MENKSIKQKSVTVNLVANGIKTLMSVLFPLITFPFASRVLGASGIGKVDYATSIVTYFSLVAAAGISTYAVREGARIRDDKEKFNKFAKEMLNINLCTTFLTYLCFGFFLCLPVLQDYKKLLIVISAGIVFTTIGMEWLFIIREEYEYITKRAVLFQFISLILLFFLVKSKDDYYWYAALTVISSGGSAILNLWQSRKIIDWKKKYVCEYRKHIKPILVIFGTSVASTLYLTMDTTMLGAMKGDTATGIYAAATKINIVISVLIGTISSTILPRVSYYIGNGLKEEYKKLMKASVDVLLMMALPAAIGMMCTSDILIIIFSGSEYIGGSLAAKILSIKVVVGAINKVLAYQVCIPYKKEKEVLVSTIAGAVFNLCANAVLIPLYGGTGASIATLGSELVVFGVLTIYSNRFFDTKVLYRRFPVYFLASIGFVAVRYLANMLSDKIMVQLTVTMVICGVGYFVILLIMKDPYLCEFIKTMRKKIERR